MKTRLLILTIIGILMFKTGCAQSSKFGYKIDSKEVKELSIYHIKNERKKVIKDFKVISRIIDNYINQSVSVTVKFKPTHMIEFLYQNQRALVMTNQCVLKIEGKTYRAKDNDCSFFKKIINKL